MLAQSQETSSEPVARQKTVTARAVGIAFALIPINQYWIVQMELVRYSAHASTVSLFFNAIFALMLITGINRLVRRVRPSWALNQGELMLIYSVIVLSTAVAGHDFLQVLVPHITWPYYMANSSNGWATLFWPHLASWAMMPDNDAAKGFFNGNDTLYTRSHILAWLRPVLVWTAFITVLLFVMQCVNVLIRKQWTDNERLSYPLIKLPLEITRQDSLETSTSPPLTKNRLFWVGFFVAATIDTVNALNYYYPAIPPILSPGYGKSFLDLSTFVPNKPWSAIGWTPVSYYPFIIGLGILMPLDFLFSACFFYLMWKAESVLVVASGLDADPNMPYANYQALGAYLLFFISTASISRHYFKDILSKAMGLSSTVDDADEPLPYRWAFIGVGVGVALLTAFAMALGLAWWLAIAFFVLYFALSLSITRMRAELGTPVHDLHFTGPDWALTDIIGPRALGSQYLGVFSIFFWFNRAYRCHPMPIQLEAFKMAGQTGGDREMRKWFWVLLTAGAVSAFSGMWILLHCYYIYGATSKMAITFGPDAWNRYNGWLANPASKGGRVAAAVGVGFLVAGCMQLLRVRLSWWPFHPLAFAVSGSWEMNLLWLPLTIAYVTKLVLVRYGGGAAFQKSLPLFYGLILGQFTLGSLLNIWGIVTNTPTYQFWQ